MPRPQPHLLSRLERLTSSEGFMAAGISDNEHVLRHTIALYDGEIHHVDRYVEDLFDLLRIENDDLVIVTSDHGEEMFEHGDMGHANSLFEETTRVPLIVRFPEGRFGALRIREAVSIVDVVPTVLDYLEVDRLPDGSGQSLLPLLRGERFHPRPIRGSLSIYHQLESVRIGDWKYIHDLNDPARGRLFNLSIDPGERRNLFDSSPQRAATMRRLLRESIDTATVHSLETETIELEGPELEQLRSLGYLH